MGEILRRSYYPSESVGSQEVVSGSPVEKTENVSRLYHGPLVTIGSSRSLCNQFEKKTIRKVSKILSRSIVTNLVKM